MSLFVVKHQHQAQTCPAGNPQVAPMLLKLLSRENAAKFGITIQAEGVADGQHQLYLIVEAPDAKKVSEFMAPFSQMGSVDVLPASHCERVVARGKC